VCAATALVTDGAAATVNSTAQRYRKGIGAAVVENSGEKNIMPMNQK